MNPTDNPRLATCSRRRFLAGTLAGTAALATGGSVFADEEDRKWKMRLSTSSIQFMRLPIEKACERIAALGFEAIDIWSPHAGCPHLDDAVNRLGPERLAELLTRLNLKPYAWSVYAGGFAKYADFIGKMGGGVAIQGSTSPCKESEISAKMKEFLEKLKPLADLAGEKDAYLAIENHGHALLDGVDSFKAFVDLNTHPRLGLALAPYHLQRLGASVEEAIEIAGKQLLFFYAWQSAPETKQLPGLGPTDFTPWLAALAKADYRWYVNPFMHGEPEPDAMSTALKKSRKYLLECARRGEKRGHH